MDNLYSADTAVMLITSLVKALEEKGVLSLQEDYLPRIEMLAVAAQMHDDEKVREELLVYAQRIKDEATL